VNLKYCLWATAIWTVIACGGSGVGLWYVLTHPRPGVSSDARAARLGEGAGTVMTIGYAAIWLPFAYQVGKRRRAAQRGAAENDERLTPKRPRGRKGK
jgi:hypothetical protein